MIWLIIDWGTRECWISTIPKDSAHSGRVVQFNKICFGNNYIELKLIDKESTIKIPSSQCIIEEENLKYKTTPYYEKDH